MKRILLTSLSIIIVLLCSPLSGVDRAQAAPIAPGISIAITPLEAVPGQAGFIYVSGGYPLDVKVWFDSEEINIFWTGDGYIAPFAFGHDEPAGDHGVVVMAHDNATGERVTQSETITVRNFYYPYEEISIGTRLSSLLDPALNAEEASRMAAYTGSQTHRIQWDWPFTVPAPDALITSQYGASREYNDGVYYNYHTGTDFRRFVNDPVVAAAGGLVAASEPFPVHGNVIIIDHGYGIFTLYAHLSETYVQAGDTVQRGQLIAGAGSTGRSTGPHLHFEVIVNGKQVDSMLWLGLLPGFIPPEEVPPLPEETPTEDEIGS